MNFEDKENILKKIKNDKGKYAKKSCIKNNF